jgi:hypothetical protein
MKIYFVKVLTFEIAYHEINLKLTEKLMKASQKRDFKRKLKQNNLHFDDCNELSNQLFESSKRRDQPRFLKKRKNVEALKLADSLLKDVHTVSK